MRIRRNATTKLVTAGALMATTVVTVTGMAGGAQAATTTTASNALLGNWTGWETSATNASRKLVTVTPVTTPATIGVTVDPSQTAQTWTGVGAALTDSSYQLLAGNEAAIRALYDPASATGAHLNLMRLPMSGTDMSTNRWSFGWNATTKTLTAPAEATLGANGALIAKSLNKDLAVYAANWTAPASMKTSKIQNGGSLAAGQETNYANFLQAQVDWYLAKGVPLKYLSIGNEPNASAITYPTMTMTDAQMATIAKAISAPLKAKGVGLVALDANWNERTHADAILAAAPGAFAQVGFHCYGGTPATMSGLSIPSLVTECSSTTKDDAQTSFAYSSSVLVKQAIDNGSTGLLMWNLALNSSGGPKAVGGCISCRGLLTVDSTGKFTGNPEFYGLAHLARAADPGAKVISTSITASGFPVVSFLNPDGSIGVYGVNTYASAQTISIRNVGGGERRFTVPAGEMFTFRGTPGAVESLTGKLVRTAAGTVAYVDALGVSHLITSQSVYDCLGGNGNLVDNVPVAQFTGLTAGGGATCSLLAVVGNTVTGTVGVVGGAVGGVVGVVGGTVAGVGGVLGQTLSGVAAVTNGTKTTSAPASTTTSVSVAGATVSNTTTVPTK